MNPWLSVVMPTFNGARYVREALDSVVLQQDDGIEVIAVDDNSTDATVRILESYASKLSIRIASHSRGNWVAGTNRGLDLARGDYVSFLHQDDFWLPGRVRALRNEIADDPPLLFLHPVHFVDASSRRLGTWNCPLPGGDLESAFVVERLLVQNFLSVASVMFPRRAALDAGGMDEGLWHTPDWDLWLKLAEWGRTRYIPTPLAAYRVHAGALSMTRSALAAEFRAQLECVLDPHLDAWKQTHARTRSLESVARFSIDTNVVLAALSHKQRPRLFHWVVGLFGLGPAGLKRYLRDSRIIERVAARIRARSRHRGNQASGPTDESADSNR